VKGLVIEIIKIVAPVSVAIIVFAQGLRVGPSQVANYFKQRTGIVLRALIATLILVPAATLVLSLALKPAAGVAIGLACLVACPPAPLMVQTAPKMGGGSAGFMASLHLCLAALAFFTVPTVLYLLSIPLGFHAEVDMGAMAWILSRTILLPIGLGLAVRAFFPAFADRLGPVLARIGSAGLVVVVLFALIALYPALLKVDLRSYLFIALVSATALAIGHLLGPHDSHEKTALAVECAVRHPLLAISIAAANFSPQKVLPVLVPCVITFIVVAMVYLFFRGRSLGAGKLAGTGAAS
jgi:BASS family bile acid:Na+ symporter